MRRLPFDQISRYNNKHGVPEYRQMIQTYLADRGWNVDLESILDTAGATGGTAAALLADCQPGDTVLLVEPFFIGHKLMLDALRFRVEYTPVPLNAPPDWSALEQQIENAEAFIVTTPANPTGQVAPPETLARLSQAAAKHDCLLIIDEMYREFIWDNPPVDDSGYSKINWEKAVLLRSFSKTYAIPGWRVGFAVTSPERIEQMAIAHDALYVGGSTIAQHAMVVTLRNNRRELNQYVENLRSLLLKNMKLLAAAFKDYGMDPLPVPATYYMLIKHNRKSDIAAMEELMKKKIVVTPANILFSNSAQDTGTICIHFAVRPEVAKKVANILRG